MVLDKYWISGKVSSAFPSPTEQGYSLFLSFYGLFVPPTLVLCSYVGTLILDAMVVVIEYVDL